MALKSTDRRVDELEINKQDALVSAENIRTINGESLLGDGDIAVQQTLVSGTNIKTINGNSLLGSGDIVITPSSSITVGTTPITSGVDGRVLFQSGGVVSQDSGFTWDNINKRFGVGTSTPQARLDVRAQGALSTDIAFRVRNSANTADLFSIAGNGTARFNGRVSQDNLGNSTFFGFEAGLNDDLTTNSNTAFGYQAGKGVTTGSGNTFIGRAAGLVANGSQNIFVGLQAGSSATNGSFNVTIGVQAGSSNTNSNNTFVGFQAGSNNTSGRLNTNIGSRAGSHNVTGEYNVFVGSNAGDFIADGVTDLTTINNSVFLGFNTRALANNQTNQIVIGHDATGLGSNTVVLGNTSIVKTILRGTINAAGLPTSPAGLVTGDIWNNLGILTIV